MFPTSRSAILSSRKAEVRVVPDTPEVKENETNDESVFSDGDEPHAGTENESPAKANDIAGKDSTHATEPAPSSLMPGQLCSKSKAWFSHPSNFWNSLVLCSYQPRPAVDFAHRSQNRLQEHETIFYPICIRCQKLLNLAAPKNLSLNSIKRDLVCPETLHHRRVISQQTMYNNLCPLCIHS
ncbi:hypothetical protein Y032_0025g1214 [Ancylostoma ceylanicum]|uniref:Uncharacterized protein n=1 Tax=Ancylostoma ceylanicum TaxID=53326 RepID=A0A016UVY7_9BILA|nr:hypothetical protein Y032_0025g1214 [Ancylostoma ceylanicum]